MKIAFVIDKIGFSIPLGLAYLSSVLKKNGFEIEIFTTDGNNGDIKSLVNYSPEIIGYSVITGLQRQYLRINRQLKEKLSFYAVFGGAHPTFFPQIINEEGVDVVCRGEAEDAFVEFAKFVDSHKELPERMLNFWIKKDKTIFQNDPRPLISDLDSLPYPDHKMFLDKFAHLRFFKRREFIAHRGCPYTCSYCFNPAYNRLYHNNGKVYRSRSPLKICDEIEKVKGYADLEFVHFVDDIFTFDVQWLREFSRVYQDRLGKPFSCNMRLDNCSPEVVSLLKKASCYLVYVGIESGNDFLRNEIMHRNMDRETIIKNIRLMQSEGIRVITENIIGLPTETYASSLETLRINAYLNPDFANASIFTPYPEVGLTEYAEKNHYFLRDFNAIDSVYYHHSNLRFEDTMEINRMLNLRCFFSFLSRHLRCLSLFNIFSYLKYNRIFQVIGDLFDRYYLYKLLPFRIRKVGFLRLVKVYFDAYRK